MHKLLVLYPEPADRTAFKEYYESTHLPLARELPGMLGWRYSFDVNASPGDSPYFAVFEADFESAEAFGDAMGSPQGAAVQADVPNYAPEGTVVVNYQVLP